MSEEQTYTPPAPGEHHEKLKPFAGTFRSAVTIWFGPDQKMESAGTMTSKWVLNDLYLEHDYVGDPMDGPFPSFEGKGFWGYNTFSNEYEGFWVDNAASILQKEAGSVDATGKVWTMLSDMPNQHGEGTLKKKSVITLIDNDHNLMEAFIVGDDGEFKNMEIEYTRV